MKSIVLNAVLCMVVLATLNGCTDKDREIASRKSNGLETFKLGKPPTEAEIAASAKKRKEDEKQRGNASSQ